MSGRHPLASAGSYKPFKIVRVWTYAFSYRACTEICAHHLELSFHQTTRPHLDLQRHFPQTFRVQAKRYDMPGHASTYSAA